MTDIELDVVIVRCRSRWGYCRRMSKSLWLLVTDIEVDVIISDDIELDVVISD